MARHAVLIVICGPGPGLVALLSDRADRSGGAYGGEADVTG